MHLTVQDVKTNNRKTSNSITDKKHQNQRLTTVG